jgi:Obg family GTPase CgtA
MFLISRGHKRRPDGGHGGNGGSVVIVADPNEQSLRWTKPHVTALSGSHGSGQGKHGRNGRNTVLRVPCGVVIRRVLDHDEEWDERTKTVRKLYPAEPELVEFDESGSAERTYDSDESSDSDSDDEDNGGLQYSAGPSSKNRQPYAASTDYDSDEDSGDDYDDYVPEPDSGFTPWGDREKVVVADLDTPGSYAVVAMGGRRGKGSSIFASRHGPLPEIEVLSRKAKPEEGEAAFLELELKLIADIGLVGFPNAGKSSLLAAMSRATPHIAPYPFTTLNPLVGYIEYRDGFRVCAADVPGLIAGASQGRGRGHDFLRHLERTKALLYIVDAAGVDGRDPVRDFEILVDELSEYGDSDMLNRRALVVANKMDLLDESQRQDVFLGLNAVIEEAGIRMQGDIIGISAGVTGEGLGALSKAIRSTVTMSEADKEQRDKIV